MDFITRLPKAARKDAIMVVVDRITKYAHFCNNNPPSRPVK